ncbi:MAG TPA: class I SAM-dependent methyltransferase [Ignavibacteriaceae bacterium]|nr:class I SAM-dependent methyltransferase [Ignavibacteriaceae bacterium]
MKSIEESVVTAMDGSDIALYPYLPYILQDIWEIGADPNSIIKLIRKHFPNHSDLKILDLGCGKGAVSVQAAKTLGCRCLGIDAIPEFIEFARKKAVEFNVEHLCTFETGDIRESVKNLTGYDILILGSIGPIFGNYYATLTTLSKCIDANGVFIIDDGYIDDNSNYSHPLIQKKEEIKNQIDLANMKLIDNVILNRNEIVESDDDIFGKLKKRCNELIEKHPDKKELFLDYIKKQEEENDVLENRVVCSTMVIKRKS